MPARKKSPVRRSPVTIPAARKKAALGIGRLLKPGLRVALTTHVNADGDGSGSEVALWYMLQERGVRAVIANPTPFPGRYRFLLQGAEHADKSNQALKHIERADVLVVLDISDLGRLGQLGPAVAGAGKPVICVDHHASDGTLPEGPRLADSTACATGELIYDLATSLNWKVSPAAARALYVAILTDTGGFRFSNTSARALQIAAHLLGQGVEPEEIYRSVYATSSEGRIRMIAEVLNTLVVEKDRGLAWVTIPPGSLGRHGVDSDDLEGVAEYPRSVQGVRMALLFRELANGRIKVSFRSVGTVDVARLAATFGGGGHRRAAGASFEGTMPTVQAKVLAAARSVLDAR